MEEFKLSIRDAHGVGNLDNVDHCTKSFKKTLTDIKYSIKRVYACNMIAAWFEEAYQLPQLGKLFNTNYQEWINKYLEKYTYMTTFNNGLDSSGVKTAWEEITLDDVSIDNEAIEDIKDTIINGGWKDYSYIKTYIGNLTG